MFIILHIVMSFKKTFTCIYRSSMFTNGIQNASLWLGEWVSNTHIGGSVNSILGKSDWMIPWFTEEMVMKPGKAKFCNFVVVGWPGTRPGKVQKVIICAHTTSQQNHWVK